MGTTTQSASSRIILFLASYSPLWYTGGEKKSFAGRFSDEAGGWIAWIAN